MMRSDVLTIYLKEMKEVLRDKKSLIFMILLPTLIVPVMMNVMITVVTHSEKKARTEILTYAIFGEEYFPELANTFDNEEGFERTTIPTPNDITPAIADGKIKFALVIPQTVEQHLAQQTQASVHLYYNNASIASKVKERASDLIDQISEKYRSERLAALGLDTPEQRQYLFHPLIIDEHGTADTREVVGAHTGGILPYLFIIFCFAGAIYPAIDIAAGEKERGTLETLLLAPVPRHKIVLGKFFVIFTTGITAALLNLASLGVALTLKIKETADIIDQVVGSVSIIDMLLVAAMLIPTAAIFASLLLSISVYARSYKEASAYCGPLNFFIIIPAFIALMPWVELNWVWAMVPISNISLAIKELIKGTMNYYMLVAILTSSFAIAAALLFFATKWFEREAVLFRQ